MKLLRKLKPFVRKTANLNVVIDTPKGCRNKYAFDFDLNGYVLKTVMPKGILFPFDFGSIPGTVAQDGDPLDALVLMDEPAFCGCLVLQSRLLGVIEALQKIFPGAYTARTGFRRLCPSVSLSAKLPANGSQRARASSARVRLITQALGDNRQLTCLCRCLLPTSLRPGRRVSCE